jgi:hypothetical protein
MKRKKIKMIEFISHDEFPDDSYVKEIVYIQISGVRYGYVAKMTRSGNTFWDEISVGVSLNGEKKYFKAFKFDSEFLKDDILAFLKARSWTKKTVPEFKQAQVNLNDFPRTGANPTTYQPYNAPTEMQDELPL